MTRQDYNRMTERELVGRYARLLVDVRTQAQTAQAGALVRITRKFGGFDADGQPCAHCGVGFRIKRLQPADIELLPKDVKPAWGKNARGR